jgi:hypothetical protein
LSANKNLTKDEVDISDDKKDPLVRVEYTLTAADLEDLKEAFEVGFIKFN